MELVWKLIAAAAASVGLLTALGRWLDDRIKRRAAEVVRSHDEEKNAHAAAIDLHDKNPDAHLHLAKLTRIEEKVDELGEKLAAAHKTIAEEAATEAIKKLLKAQGALSRRITGELNGN